MKPKYKKLVLWLVTLLHVSLIFSFSFQDANHSTVLSEGLTSEIKSAQQMEKEISDEKNPDGSAKYKDFTVRQIAEKNFRELEKFLRKMAHFSLFFLLGVFINLLMGAYGIKGGFRVTASVLFAGAIAFADETIQLFSAGRAGRFTDVLIDTSGAALAAILFFVGGFIYEKAKSKRPKMDS